MTCEYCSLKCIASGCECVCHNPKIEKRIILHYAKRNWNEKLVYLCNGCFGANVWKVAIKKENVTCKNCIKILRKMK